MSFQDNKGGGLHEIHHEMGHWYWYIDTVEMNWLRSSGRVLWKLSSGFFMAMHVLYQQEQEGYITSLSPFLGFSVSPFSSLLNFDCYPLFGGLPRWLRGKRICLQSRRPGCDPWIGKIPGEGNGYLLQYFCLENPMDRRAWRATVHGVAKSQTWLSDSHYWVQLWLFCQWSCWFPASGEKQFSCLPSLFSTPLCCVACVSSNSWNAAEGTQLTHFEKCGKSIYFTFAAPVPPAFLWAGIDNGISGDPHILPFIWSLSNKTVASFSF